jgi:hypothetical protein
MAYNNNHVIQHAFFNLLYFWAQSWAVETFAIRCVVVRVEGDESLVISTRGGQQRARDERLQKDLSYFSIEGQITFKSQGTET